MQENLNSRSMSHEVKSNQSFATLDKINLSKT